MLQISWVRRRDWHILTSGMFTYTNDERFQVLHAEGSDDWTLQIKYVQKRDNGTYECQVSVVNNILSEQTIETRDNVYCELPLALCEALKGSATWVFICFQLLLFSRSNNTSYLTARVM